MIARHDYSAARYHDNDVVAAAISSEQSPIVGHLIAASFALENAAAAYAAGAAERCICNIQQASRREELALTLLGRQV